MQFCLMPELFPRNDFQPVTVRIRDKIDFHFRILKADASHLLMLCVSRVKIIYMESKMDFIVSQVIGAVHIPQPGQLQLMGRCAVSQVYKLETSVRGVFCADNFKSESFFVEVQ